MDSLAVTKGYTKEVHFSLMKQTKVGQNVFLRKSSRDPGWPGDFAVIQPAGSKSTASMAQKMTED